MKRKLKPFLEERRRLKTHSDKELQKLINGVEKELDKVKKEI